MAKRYQIINVLRKPRKCPNCGEEVWDIIYGTGDMKPWEFLTEYRKSAVMGGDNIPNRLRPLGSEGQHMRVSQGKNDK